MADYLSRCAGKDQAHDALYNHVTMTVTSNAAIQYTTTVAMLLAACYHEG